MCRYRIISLGTWNKLGGWTSKAATFQSNHYAEALLYTCRYNMQTANYGMGVGDHSVEADNESGSWANKISCKILIGVNSTMDLMHPNWGLVACVEIVIVDLNAVPPEALKEGSHTMKCFVQFNCLLLTLPVWNLVHVTCMLLAFTGMFIQMCLWHECYRHV